MSLSLRWVLLVLVACACVQPRAFPRSDAGQSSDAAVQMLDAGSTGRSDAGPDGGAGQGDAGVDAGPSGDGGTDAGLADVCGAFEVCEADVGCLPLCSGGLGLQPVNGPGMCSCGSSGEDSCTGGTHCLCQLCANAPGLCVTTGQQACLCATSYAQTFQCETPSFDAGLPAVGCHAASDCPTSGESVSWCQQPDAGDEPSGASCIAGACVWECGGGGRTCAVEADGGCLDCGGGAQCPATSCGQLPSWSSATVGDSTCPSPITSGTTLQLQSGSTCALTAGLSRTSLSLGTWTQLSDGELLAEMPDLGGVCTGLLLPTNAIRIVWSCPDCQFVVTTP